MARSNRGKYKNLDYVLIGKPGKRRWHKRQKLDPAKRVESGLAAINSAAALSNRNRRELYLINRARKLGNSQQDRIEKKKAWVRAISYGTIVGGAVALTIAGIGAAHKMNNANALRQGSEEMAKLIRQRQIELRKAVDGIRAVDPANPLRTSKITHPVVDIARAHVNGKGSFGDREVSWAQNVIEDIKSLDDKIIAVSDDILGFLKRGKKGAMSEYEKRIRWAVDYVKSTDLNELTNSDDAVLKLVSGDPDFLSNLTKKSYGVFTDDTRMVDMSAGQVVDEYIKKNLADAAFGRKSDSTFKLSDNQISKLTKGLRDDILSAWYGRKARASAILRTGQSVESVIGGEYRDIPIPRQAPGFRSLEYKGVASRIESGKPRKRGVFSGLNLTKREKLKRIGRAGATMLDPRLKSEGSLRTLGSAAATTGLSLGNAHMAAGLASNVSRGLIDSIDRKEESRRRDIRLALIRQAMGETSAGEGNSISDAVIQRRIARQMMTNMESPGYSYSVNNGGNEVMRQARRRYHRGY